MARSVCFGVGANGISRIFANGLGFDAWSRGASACATSVRRFHLAQPLSVFPRRLAELPAIFTAKLRRAFVAHGETDRNDILCCRHEQRPGRLQAYLLLILNRRHRRNRLEVPVKGTHAHASDACKIVDPQRLGIVSANPADGAADLRHPAVGKADLPHHRALRAIDETPENFSFNRGRKDGEVGWKIGRAHV